MTEARAATGQLPSKRNRGSRRQRVKRRVQRERWATQGVKVGSVNIAGAKDLKIELLFATHQFDILCLQETWLVGEQQAELTYPGFTVLE